MIHKKSRKASLVSLGSKVSIEGMGVSMHYFDNKIDSNNTAQLRKQMDIFDDLENSGKMSITSMETPNYCFGTPDNNSEMIDPSILLDKRSYCSNMDENEGFCIENVDLDWCLKKLKQELDSEKGLQFKQLTNIQGMFNTGLEF